MSRYVIEPLNKFSENEKGSTFTFEDRPTSSFLFATRKQGAQFGNHWHEGVSSTKDPELLLFISGEMEMWVSDTNGQNEERVNLKAPLKLKIYPHVLHRFEAVTDCIFLEFNSLDEHVADTKYPQ